jgi:membrane-associated phospholipid phosphatase
VALAHGLLLVLLGLLQRVGEGRVGSLVRDVAPIVLLLALYGAIDTLNQGGGRQTLDPAIQRWEHAVFGGQPSRDWWRSHPSAAWSWLLHAAYFSYFAIVPFPIALYLWRREAGRVRRAVLTIITAFVACYACFILLPVAGPYYEFARPDGPFVANGPARLVYAMLARGSSFGAAFPSSHVAGTWAAVAATAAGAPGWALVLAVPAVLLTVGVVYTQMHYAVDVVAGLAVALMSVGMAAMIHGKRAG